MAGGMFEFMREQGWSTFTIMHERETGRITLRGAREWFDAIDWSLYGTEDLVSTMEWYETQAVIPRIQHHPCRDEYDEIVSLMKAGLHQKLEILADNRQDIRFITAIHSTRLGQPAGGIRRHPLEDPEIEVFADILNLARGMSFKNAAAGIPNGGCKLGIHCSTPPDGRDERFYGFLAFCIDRSMAFTGPDMGMTLEDANRIRKFTKNIVGGTEKTGSGGATGVTAAHGVLAGMKAALGEGGLAGRTVAVQGVGELGRPLVLGLVEAGARVVAADVSEQALASLPPSVVRADPDRILETECDVLAPCAVGGVLNERTIPLLRCRTIVGGANNQLRASSEDDEYRMARLIAGRGIVYVPDWIVNAGGVIQGKLEHVGGPSFRREHALAEAERIVSANVLHVLHISHRDSITPVEAAYQKFGYAVYGSTD